MLGVLALEYWMQNLEVDICRLHQFRNYLIEKKCQVLLANDKNDEIVV